MIAGKLTSTFDLFQIAVGYAALGVAAAVVAMLAARNPVQERFTGAARALRARSR